MHTKEAGKNPTKPSTYEERYQRYNEMHEKEVVKLFLSNSLLFKRLKSYAGKSASSYKNELIKPIEQAETFTRLLELTDQFSEKFYPAKEAPLSKTCYSAVLYLGSFVSSECALLKSLPKFREEISACATRHYFSLTTNSRSLAI